MSVVNPLNVPLWRSALQIMSIYVRQHPLIMSSSMALLILAGLVEGVGIMSAVPLIDVLTSRNPDDWTEITKVFSRVLDQFGLPISKLVLIATIVLAMLIKAMLLFASTIYVEFAIADFVRDIRLRMIGGMVDANWSFFTGEPIGKLTNSLLAEAQESARAAKQLIGLCSAAIQTVVYAATVLIISWQLTVSAFIAGLIILAVFHGLVLRSRSEAHRRTSVARTYVAKVVDWLQSAKSLKAMGLNDRIEAYLADYTNQLTHADKRLILIDRIISTLQEPLSVILIAVIFVVSTDYFAIQLPGLLVSMALFNRILNRMTTLQSQLKGIANSEAGHLAVQEYLTRLSDCRELTSKTGKAQPRFDSVVSLENVSVAYGTRHAVSGVSIAIPKGQLTALLGASGAGKSTVLDLVANLAKPSDGRVMIDDVDLRDLDLLSWRHCLGYVPQEMTLLNDSVRNNLTLRDEAIEDDAIWDALKLAGAEGFVSQLPDGLDTTTGERGMEISGGQRQRLAIARALVRKPTLLLLDEATSALDRETELAFCQTLRGLLPHTTILATSHRPAIEDVADNVVYLEEGRVINRLGYGEPIPATARV